jgi:hypothetical protein
MVCPVFGKPFPSIPGIPGGLMDQETLDEVDQELLDAVVDMSMSIESPIGRPFGV